MECLLAWAVVMDPSKLSLRAISIERFSWSSSSRQFQGRASAALPTLFSLVGPSGRCRTKPRREPGKQADPPIALATTLFQVFVFELSLSQVQGCHHHLSPARIARHGFHPGPSCTAAQRHSGCAAPSQRQVPMLGPQTSTQQPRHGGSQQTPASWARAGTV